MSQCPGAGGKGVHVLGIYRSCMWKAALLYKDADTRVCWDTKGWTIIVGALLSCSPWWTEGGRRNNTSRALRTLRQVPSSHNLPPNLIQSMNVTNGGLASQKGARRSPTEKTRCQIQRVRYISLLWALSRHTATCFYRSQRDWANTAFFTSWTSSTPGCSLWKLSEEGFTQVIGVFRKEIPSDRCKIWRPDSWEDPA